MNIITRFAPSPTGFLHIGGARTALFNYLFARHHGGKFLLRVEDTDKSRSTKEAVDAILEGMDWLGIESDASPLFQSKHTKRHHEIAHKLLAEGKAYYCYVLAEELNQMRDQAQNKGEVFRFQSPWRDKQPSQTPDNPPVIRIKSPQEGFTIIKDLVQGEVKVDNCELDDLIILRSDQTPTYNLAVVVDDYDMGITHVIRGDDHLNNTFRQKVIYEAMGWKVPEFAHIPLIHGADGAKMSKRHGATSVIEYKEMGYLPEAIRNYLLRLGWSHGDEEIISDENAIKWFGLETVGKSPARFDFNKLDNLNKHYIKEKKDEDLFYLIQDKIEIISKDKIIKSLGFLKERAVSLNDFSGAEIYNDGYKKDLEEKDQEIINEKSSLISELKEVIVSINDWNHDGIREAIGNYSTERNIKMKEFAPALRIVLTFSSSSVGGIFDIIETLEKEEVLRRFSYF